MTLNLNNYASSPERREEGVEVEVLVGWKWRVRSHFSKTFQEGQKNLQRRIREIPEDASDERRAELGHEYRAEHYARNVLIGWDDDVEFDGKPFPYSLENAKALLMESRVDGRFPGLLDNLERAFVDLQNFRERDETERKNA